MEQKYTTSKPSWVPEEDDDKFACRVMSGIDGIKDLTVGNINPNIESGVRRPKKRAPITEDAYVDGVLSGDRMMLSRAITLIESNSPKPNQMIIKQGKTAAKIRTLPLMTMRGKTFKTNSPTNNKIRLAIRMKISRKILKIRVWPQLPPCKMRMIKLHQKRLWQKLSSIAKLNVIRAD